jgi:4-hydroxy-4-methyl-2-oxoglutarate aldolase
VNDDPAVADLSARFLKLYTGAVADVLDANGFRQQVLPAAIQPVTLEMKVAGPAFPGFGLPTDDETHNDMALRLKMLESVTTGCVAVWACHGHEGSAHWGEIMSRAAMERGCAGAVIDGGLRDTEFVVALGFPVFSRFRNAASSIGRWDIVEWNTDIAIGTTKIRPGDWMFGDVDGVVVVPSDIVLDVLGESEAKVATEALMRSDLESGLTVTEAFDRHGAM